MVCVVSNSNLTDNNRRTVMRIFHRSIKLVISPRPFSVHWNTRVVLMPTLLLPVAPKVGCPNANLRWRQWLLMWQHDTSVFNALLTERVAGHIKERLRWNQPIHSPHDDVINGNLFRVTGHLCRGIPRTKASDAELWCFLWSASE